MLQNNPIISKIIQGITNKILSKYVQKICVAYDKMERFFSKKKLMVFCATTNPAIPVAVPKTPTESHLAKFGSFLFGNIHCKHKCFVGKFLNNVI